MMRFVVVALTLLSLTLVVPAFGNTHKDTYAVPCSDLWAAVKDTLKNSGNYGITASDDNAMTASYTVGSSIRRGSNSVALHPQSTGCDLQVDSAYRGLMHDDAGDFKKRVDESLARLKTVQPSEPAKQPDATK